MRERITKENYLLQIKEFHPKSSFLKSGGKAFLVGGLISLSAQGILNFYTMIFDYRETTLNSLVILTLILIASLLTGIGVYDKIGQFGGAGSAIPITGFANAMTSAALESKSEGTIQGIAANMFKLVGAIIVYGVITASMIGLIRVLIDLLFLS